MDGKIKEIIENEMDCLITDVDFVIKKEGSLQALVNMLEAAINYTHSCTELKDKESLTLKDAFIAGYKKRALMSDLKYDEVSELNAITNFKCWKSFDLDL